VKLFSGLADRFRQTFAKTRDAVQEGVDRVLKGRELGALTLDELESVLLQADLGIETAEAVVEAIRDQARRGRLAGADVRQALAAHLREGLKGAAAPLALESHPAVLLVLGVNGSGKTTTCGKLAARLQGDGRRVLLAAADTFRAAAIEQLERWGERVGVPVVKQGPGADPSAVAFDAVKAAQARDADVLIVDTAGRLHTKTNLMQELGKVKRVIARQLPGAPHETLLVLDATTGQNGINQARLFHEALTLTGLVLTKLDGTARGGIVVRITRELGLPIKLVGTGERPGDLAPFDPEAFVTALVGD
jgi:fused signal recognition particle receptor